jgi:uncharacterized RDD family membrane protein YckC
VNGFVLGLDIGSLLFGVGIPGLLWALLYLLAWEHPTFAESLGFGRATFWLLVPGGLLASYTAIVPIAPVSNAWVGVDLAGAIFPLVIGVLALGRYAPPLARSGALFLGLLAVEAAALFVVVLPASSAGIAGVGRALAVGSPGAEVLLVAIGAAAISAAVGLVALRSESPGPRRVAFLLALVSGVLALTFAGSAAVRNVGIVESFPFYILPPIGAGVVAAELAPRVFPGEEGFAMPCAFLGTTFGVLLGADLLRQPGLYPGEPGLYTIGGAGVLDLVYLSGLLALGSALLTYRLLGGSWTPIGAPLPVRRLSPMARLRQGYRFGTEGRLAESLAASADAARTAAAQARLLVGREEPAEPENPWSGIAVPGWVVSDQANLENVAKAGTADGREGFRAWLTARWLVLVGASIGRPRYASVGDRILAFALDLALLGAPAATVFIGLARGTSGGVLAVLGSVSFNAAIYGFVAVAFLYFALSEFLVGTTVGKWARGLWVSDRDLRPVGGMAALVRNVSLLPVLTLEGVGGALSAAVLVKGAAAGGASLLGIGLPSGLLEVAGIAGIVLLGLGLLGSMAVLAIGLTSERQRVGDLWAGTWVVREPIPAARPGTAAPPSAAGAAPPSG